MDAFFGATPRQFQDYLTQRGAPTVHARAIFRELYKRGAADASATEGIGASLRAAVAADFHFALPRLAHWAESAYDHSVKFRAELGDGTAVETVLMPESSRITVCLSSQVGCAQACTFCHTGRMGLVRNLTAAEIVGQVVAANAWIRIHPEWLKRVRLGAGSQITNVVFMGMGEPLDNLGAVGDGLAILHDPYGFNLSLRKLSVSTAGHLDGLRTLTLRYPDLSIALSLHATTDAARSRIMPINRRWPLAELIGFLRSHYSGPGLGRSLLVQYTVIAGVNDSGEDAARLFDLLQGLPVKINLIPLNEIEPSRLRAPSVAGLESFRDQLHAAGFRVMVRYSKGQDITAACGQLIVSPTQSHSA